MEKFGWNGKWWFWGSWCRVVSSEKKFANQVISPSEVAPLKELEESILPVKRIEYLAKREITILKAVGHTLCPHILRYIPTFAALISISYLC